MKTVHPDAKDLDAAVSFVNELLQKPLSDELYSSSDFFAMKNSVMYTYFAVNNDNAKLELYLHHVC